MPVFHYVHLNVFPNQPFTGNHLAVFLDAEGIDEKQMQRIPITQECISGDHDACDGYVPRGFDEPHDKPCQCYCHLSRKPR